MAPLWNILLGLGGAAAVWKLVFDDEDTDTDTDTDTGGQGRAPTVKQPKAFISFDYDHDSEAKHLFAGQALNSRTPFSIVDQSARQAMPPRKWVKMVEEKIARCHLLVVLVGKTMASATGVHKEIEIARRLDVPIFGVYVNGADESSRLPPGLTRRQVIEWTWPGISRRIKGALRRGKNTKG